MNGTAKLSVTAPKFQWVWNVNTIAVLVGSAAGFVAWGYTLSELQSGRIANAANIERLTGDVRRIDETIRRLDNHELRLGAVERQATDASVALRAVETAINSLASDMRLTREILERLERSQNGRVRP